MTTVALLLVFVVCALAGALLLANAAYVALDHDAPSRARARATRQSVFAGAVLLILALAFFAAALGWRP